MTRFTTTEALGSSTTTSSTPSTKLTHTVTNPTGKSYIIFFSCQTTISNVASRPKVDLLVDGAQVATFSTRFNNSNEDHNTFFFEQVTGKTASFDCVIQLSSTDNTATATILNARIVAWDYTGMVGLDLQYGADDNNVGLTSSYDVGATVSFTPPSTGNYFVLGCAGISPGSTSEEALARLDVDGTFYPFLTDTVVYWGRESPSVVTDAFNSFCTGTRQSLATGGSRTVRVSAASETSSVGTWQYSRVLAFREDAFLSSNFASADTAAEDANTSETYETRATVTTTDPGVNAKDYFILAGISGGQSGDTAEAERTQLNVTIAGTLAIMMEHRPKDLTDHLSLGVAAYRSDAAAFTVITQHRLQASLDNTSQAKSSWIIILRDDTDIIGKGVIVGQSVNRASVY